MLSKSLLHGLQIVVRHDDGIRRRRTRHARGIRERERRHAGARGGKQRVHVAVVATIKLEDFRTARKTAGQTHGGHGGLRAGVDHADLLRSGALDDSLGEQGLTLRGRAEGQAIHGRLLHGLDNLRVCVAVNHGAVGAHQIDVLVTVHVPQARALAPCDNAGLTAHRTVRADRRIHAAGDDLGRTLEPLLGLGDIRHGNHCNYLSAIQKSDIATAPHLA